MRSFVICVFVLCLFIWHGNRYVHTLGPSHINLEEELSTSAFLALKNFSYAKTQLAYTDHLDLKRSLDSVARINVSSEAKPSRREWVKEKRWDLRDKARYTSIPHFQATFEKTMERLCYIQTSSYKAAVVDLEYYYPLRYFYRNVRDFEIGYLTHEIVHSYSNILELYHMMVWQYEMQNFTYFAPVNYMVYIYTNMALLGKHLIHQCNMMSEIDKKYHGAISMFNDSTTTPLPDGSDLKKIMDTSDSVKYVRNISIELRKERQRDRKDRLNELFKRPIKPAIDKYLQEKRMRKPFKSKWPLTYGWSIEENWKGYSYWSGYHNYSDEEEEMDKNKYL